MSGVESRLDAVEDHCGEPMNLIRRDVISRDLEVIGRTLGSDVVDELTCWLVREYEARGEYPDSQELADHAAEEHGVAEFALDHIGS